MDTLDKQDENIQLLKQRVEAVGLAQKTTDSIAEVKDGEAEDMEERRPRRRSSDGNKNVSTNNANAQKPEVLETNLPPLQMKVWYQK